MGYGKMLLATVAVVSATTMAGCSGGNQKSEGETTAASQGAGADPAAAPTATPSAPQAPPPESTDTLSGATLAQFTGTAAAGEAVFVQCRTCHVTDPGVNRIGPSLHGIVGRPAGQVAGFNYTPANRDSGITWTEEKLFQYLERPQRVVPGTKMAFAGITDNQKRADLIAWLKTQGPQ